MGTAVPGYSPFPHVVILPFSNEIGVEPSSVQGDSIENKQPCCLMFVEVYK